MTWIAPEATAISALSAALAASLAILGRILLRHQESSGVKSPNGSSGAQPVHVWMRQFQEIKDRIEEVERRLAERTSTFVAIKAQLDANADALRRIEGKLDQQQQRRGR